MPEMGAYAHLGRFMPLLQWLYPYVHTLLASLQTSWQVGQNVTLQVMQQGSC